MERNHTTGAPRGFNVFDDLLDACISTVASLKVAGNKPLTVIDHVMLSAGIDRVLDVLGQEVGDGALM